jgi:K+ transporter
MPTHPESTLPIGRSGLAALGLAALGIVFGDIGTSPLYTLKTVLSMTVGGPTPDVRKIFRVFPAPECSSLEPRTMPRLS